MTEVQAAQTVDIKEPVAAPDVQVEEKQNASADKKFEFDESKRSSFPYFAATPSPTSARWIPWPFSLSLGTGII